MISMTALTINCLAIRFTGVKKSLTDFGVTSAGGDSQADNDDDFELFGSDDEVDEEAEKAKAERVKAYNEKKSKSKHFLR